MKDEVSNRIKLKNHYKEVLDFVQDGGRSGLCYLRGRRRIGKTAVLQLLSQEKKAFYFSGKFDEATNITIKRLKSEWCLFCEDNSLLAYKDEYVTWEVIFERLFQYAKLKKLIIIFDEIQWIAKSLNGFVGTIKNFWLKFESTQNIKMIICGSSNKFFIDNTGGEEKILRGVKTRSDIEVAQYSLIELKNYYFKQFDSSEVLFIYMMVGGLPYYLNQMPTNTNFIQTLNETFFVPQTIFLSEVDEILGLEFNQQGLATIKLILSCVGINGKKLSEIIKLTNLSNSTVYSSVEKLIEYKILKIISSPLAPQKGNQRGHKYVIDDYYLNFYFSILLPANKKIKKNNAKNLIVNNVFNWPSSFLYVENFTGKAFERVVENILLNSQDRHEQIFKKMNLQNCYFDVGEHWGQHMQVDLIIHNSDDAQLRLIECKWTTNAKLIGDAVQSINDKGKHFPSAMKVVVSPLASYSEAHQKLADSLSVILITIDDLF